MSDSPTADLRPPAPGEVRQALRAATAEAHEQLEASLDLGRRVADRQAVARMLERFLGFHSIWERAIRQHAALRSFHEPRSRLPHLRRDLAALGRTNAEQAALPACEDAAGLADSAAGAIGSIYVLEGSTLGGQLIGRALAEQSWTPPGGLTYFNPYQGRTGEMWRAFGAWAETAVAPQERTAAVAGANRTFALLQGWLTA